MADVTRKEFTALAARVSALEGGKPQPVPVQDVTVFAPTITVSGLQYTINGSLTANTASTFTYLQLAVRGTGAKDLALSPNTSLPLGASKTLTATATGQPGNYTTWVAFSRDGKTWADGPKATFTLAGAPVTPDTPTPVTPTPAGDRNIALVGASGLEFNSLVFRQSAADAVAFGTKRGTPVDGLLYFTPRQNWNDFQYHPGDHQDWLEQGRIIVTSMPHAPESEGDQMNQRGANDGYRDQQRALGRSIADAGLNHPTHVIRVDWECNGNWYHWSANRPGGAEALKASIRNYVTNLRAGGATQVKFDLCFNKGPSQAGHDFDIFPGADIIDVVGVDQYDMWGPSFNASDWEKEMTKSPTIRTLAAFASQQDVMWSIDECGNTHGGSAMGGDNPTYWELMHKEILAHAGNCAWHNTYDDRGAPATLLHDFGSNPRSYTTYQRLWSPA